MTENVVMTLLNATITVVTIWRLEIYRRGRVCDSHERIQENSHHVDDQPLV